MNPVISTENNTITIIELILLMDTQEYCHCSQNQLQFVDEIIELFKFKPGGKYVYHCSYKGYTAYGVG